MEESDHPSVHVINLLCVCLYCEYLTSALSANCKYTVNTTIFWCPWRASVMSVPDVKIQECSSPFVKKAWTVFAGNACMFPHIL